MTGAIPNNVEVPGTLPRSGEGAGPSTEVGRPPVLDVVVAAGLFVVGVVEVLGARLAEDVVEGPVVLNLVAVALGTLPLAFRRAAPFLVALVVCGAFAGRALADAPLEIYPTQ